MHVINRLCPCCGVDPQFLELPVNCDNLDLADLGAGYVMYFKMVIFFGCIMILFSIINIIKAISNTTKGYCTTSTTTISSTSNAALYVLKGWPVCSFDWITAHSVANYGVMNVDSQEKTWVLIFFLFYWFTLSGLKSYIKKTNKLIDVSNDTPSDWTLIIKNLPKDEPAEQIRANFEAYGNLGKSVCPVKKVNLVYKCDEYIKLAAKVAADKRQMKTLQMKETPSAIERMKEKLKSEGKKIVDEKKIKPDKTCFSLLFQEKARKLTDESTEVSLVYAS